MEVGRAAGAEALVECRGEDGHGNGFVDGGFDRPAAFAGIGDAAFEIGQGRVFHQRGGGEVEQPGGDDAAAPPDFGDVADVEIVLVVFRVAERSGFGIDLVHMLADVGAVEDAEAFGVGGHDAVLDAVVDHFDEVAGAVGAAVEITLLGGAAELLAAGGARDVAGAGGERGEDGVEAFHDVVFAADHHAVAALEAPDAAAGADVDVVDASWRRGLWRGGCRRCSRNCRRR